MLTFLWNYEKLNGNVFCHSNEGRRKRKLAFFKDAAVQTAEKNNQWLIDGFNPRWIGLSGQVEEEEHADGHLK